MNGTSIIKRIGTVKVINNRLLDNAVASVCSEYDNGGNGALQGLVKVSKALQIQHMDLSGDYIVRRLYSQEIVIV